MMDAKARLDEIRDKLLERTRAKLEIDYSGRGVLTVNDVMQILLEAGVTLPPQPAGPVTLTFVVGDLYQGLCEPWDTRLVALGFARGQQVRITIEDAATPFTLLTPAEVERRAREWAETHRGWAGHGALADGLVAALTREAK